MKRNRTAKAWIAFWTSYFRSRKGKRVYASMVREQQAETQAKHTQTLFDRSHQMARKGYSNAEIADAMGVSESTVRTIVERKI